MLKNFCKSLCILLLFFCGIPLFIYAGGKDSLLSKSSGNYSKDTTRINLYLKLADDFLITSSEQSLKYAYNALDLATQIDYLTGMADAERLIGDDYASQNDRPKALSHLIKALDLCENNEAWAKRKRALILNDLGEYYLNFHDYTKAIDFYNKAAEIYSENKSSYQYILVLSNLAGAYQKIGDNSRAEKTALDALRQSQLAMARVKLLQYTQSNKHDDSYHLLIGDNYRTLGGVYMNRIMYDSAEVAFKKAVTFYTKDPPDEDAKLTALQSIGNIYLEREDPLRAESYYQQVLTEAQKSGFSYLVAGSYQKLAIADSMMGNFPRALSNFKKYVAIKDSAESIEKSIAISKINSHKDLEAKQKHIEQLTDERNKQEISIKFKNSLMLFFSVLLPTIIVLESILLVNYIQKQKTNLRLSEQKEELQTLNSVKDRLFSIISHDLRSPLSNLEAILKLMESGDLSNNEVVILSGQLTHNVQETSYMLDNLLQWSRSQMKGITPRKQIINLPELANQVVGFFNAQADKKAIDIRVEFTEVLTTIADLEMIKLVIRNLLANAIKFTPSAGKIIIKIKSEKGQVLVSVADSGIGMTEQMIKKLFSLDAVTTPGTQNEKGTGLGLLLCKDFVERNNGKIWAVSTQGKGSIFTFSLPLISERSPVEAPMVKEKFIE